ncbi:MAG: DUF3987 domain-containing protein [Enterovibrio sp.]
MKLGEYDLDNFGDEMECDLEDHIEPTIEEKRAAFEIAKAACSQMPAAPLPTAAGAGAANDGEEVIEQDADLISIAAASPLALFADELAAAAQMPRNTTFLTVLSIFSGLCSRAAAISYDGDTGTQPAGLYFCAEQPPATAKSRVLNAAQLPMFSLTKDHRRALLDQKAALSGDESEEAALQLGEIDRQLDALPSFLTDATPEALDMNLSDTSGFFAIASAEQAAINTMLGISYKADGGGNKDLFLKGYNGEWHHAMRKGRKAYRGKVVGAVCVIAQEGMINNILEASNGTGTVERFMLWSEGHLLGRRSFINPRYQTAASRAAYFDAVKAVYNQIDLLASYDDLPRLHLSVRAWSKVYALREQLEPTLANGAENSTDVLRGIIGKIDILIMKLAGILHLSIDPDNPIIDDARVNEAIAIANAYIQHIRGLIGTAAVESLSTQDKAILKLINDGAEYSEQYIVDKFRRAKAFASGGRSSTENVKKSILSLSARRLIITGAANGQRTYRMRRSTK